MDEQNVVSYEGNKVSLYAPSQGGRRDIAYVRPGDEVALNFDIGDNKALKVEVIKGDIHIVFANGSTLTLVSMAAIGFGDSAPRLVTMDGRTLSLEEFLSVTDVLDYNKALLILANENQVEYSNSEPKLIQIASDQDADNTAGMPISGQGNSDVLTKGVPSDVIDTTGTVEQVGVATGRGSFVSTIYSTNQPYTLDKSNYLPGDTTPKNLPSLDTTVRYGSQLSPVGNTQVDGHDYLTWQFENGFDYGDDKFSLLYANEINTHSNANTFINNSTDEMKYVFNMNYTRGTFPSYIEIVVPKKAEDIIKLEEGAGLHFSNIQQTEDGTVYSISDINPVGVMQFIMSFAANTEIMNFDLVYNIKYLDPSSGAFLDATSSTSLSLYPVSQESHLDKSNGFVLSTVPNPVNATTGNGDDIIVGGGGNNIINSGGGNDRVFTYGGDDLVMVNGGDNQVWGSQGNDMISSNGTGNNQLYYDNRKPVRTRADESDLAKFANTNTASAGMTLYYGYDAAALKGFAGSDFKNLSKINDYDLLLVKAQGIDLVKGFQNIYLSQYNDTVVVSNARDLGDLYIHGGDMPINPDTGQPTRTDKDTIIIDENFANASIRIGDRSSVEDNSGRAIMSFDGFEIVRGSKNDETFYGNLVAGFSGTTVFLQLDGMGGNDTLTYEDVATGGFITFNANEGVVQLYDGTTDTNGDFNKNGANSIRNFQIIKGSSGADTFYGSFSQNYIYGGLDNTDTVSYKDSTSGVTIVLDGSGKYYVYKTSEYTTNEALQADTGLHKDTLEGNFNFANLQLSSRRDIIIVTDEDGSYTLDAGAGQDVLSYGSDNLTAGISVIFDNGVTNGMANVYKATGGTADGSGGKGTDSFKVMITPPNNSSDSINIQTIIGTKSGSDYFLMDDATGVGNRGFSLDGNGGGNNTLSYANVTTPSVNNNGTEYGVTFVFNGASSSVTRILSNTVDYFKNFQHFIGTAFNDVVIFSASTTLNEIKGLTFDMGGGMDVVNFAALRQSEVNHIVVTFDTAGTMFVDFWDTVRGSAGQSEFQNTNGVYGTVGNDYFNAANTEGITIFFDGGSGYDTADYSSIALDLNFNLFSRSNNVIKGTRTGNDADTLVNVQHIIGGSGNNTYYLDSSLSYTIDDTASANGLVSYYRSLSPITFNLDTNQVTKGNQTDQLINVEGVKGSNGNDTFVVDYSMSAPSSGYFDLYGNDIWGETNGDQSGGFSTAVNPKNDTDWVEFTTFTAALAITLDSSTAGKFATYDATGQISGEGSVDINGLTLQNGNTLDLHLFYMEALRLGTQNDTVNILSSYGGTAGKVRWEIDGYQGTNNEVSYALDGNLSNNNGSVLQVTLSGNTTVQRFYAGDNAADSTTSGGSMGVNALQSMDTLINIQTLTLSQFNDTVTISTGWQTSKITDIYGGGGEDTISFAGITENIEVDFNAPNGDANGFTSKITTGASGTLPNFHEFNNVALSGGVSNVIFHEGAQITGVTIIGNTNINAVGNLDFRDVANPLTISLGADNNTADLFSNSTTNISVTLRSSRSNNGFTMILDHGNNVVNASLAKNISFTGVAGTTGNELNYTGTLGFGVKIQLGDFYVNGVLVQTGDGGRVIKQGNNSIYDQFDGSFTTIYGTSQADTVWISNLSSGGGAPKTVILGGEVGDNVLIDLQNSSGTSVAAFFNIETSTIFGNSGMTGNSMNVNGFQGVNEVNFGPASNNTIIFGTDFEGSSQSLSYAVYNGTDNPDNNIVRKLDFSAMQNVIFDATTSKVSKDAYDTAYAGINWVQGKDQGGNSVDAVFNRFYTIVAASLNTMFYGQNRFNYVFDGGSHLPGGSGNAVMNYSQAQSNVEIVLLSHRINKATSFFDTFNNVTKIEGSRFGDTLVINSTGIPADIQNITIDGGGSTSDTVDFRFTDTTRVFADVGTGSITFRFNSNTATPVALNLVNFNIIRFTHNADEVTVNSSSTDGYVYDGNGSNYSNNNPDSVPQSNQDKIIYNGGTSGNAKVSYDAATGKVSRDGNADIDTVFNFDIIEYTGAGGVMFMGSETTNRTYNGSAASGATAVIDYSLRPSSSAVVVHFDTKSIDKGINFGTTGNKDYFNDNITHFVGSQGDDKFILASSTNTNLIYVYGGGGNDVVSYELYNPGSQVTFVIDSAGLVGISGANPFSRYQINTDPNKTDPAYFADPTKKLGAITGFQLTNSGNMFMGNLDSSLHIIGGTGIDYLNYAQDPTSANANINIDFTNNAVAKEGGGTDTFENFNGIITGSGDDTVRIDNTIINSNNTTGTIDVGGGNNSLYANIVTYNLTVDYSANNVANVTFKGGSLPAAGVTTEYKGFQTMELGTGVNSVNFTYNSAYATANLRFFSASQTIDSNGFGDASFYFTGGSGLTQLFLSNAGITDITVSTTSSSTPFMTLEGFTTFGANAFYELHIKASGMGGRGMSHIYQGGKATNGVDEIEYSSAVTGLTAKFVSDSTGVYIAISGTGTNGFTDRLYDIEHVTLSNQDDVFDVGDFTLSGYSSNTSPNAVVIDMGGGLNNVLSFASKSSAITGEVFWDTATNNIGITGTNIPNIIGWQLLALTNLNDKITFAEDLSATIDGNGGTTVSGVYGDTADYTTKPFTNGVVLSIMDDGSTGGNNIYMNIMKQVGTDVYNDRLKNFNNYTLTNNDDTFTYAGNLQISKGTTAAEQLITIDMKGGTKDTVDFSSMGTLANPISNTTFTYKDVSNDLVVYNDGSSTNGGVLLSFLFKGANIVILGGQNSLLQLETIPTVGAGTGITFITDISNDSKLDLSNVNSAITDILVDTFNSTVQDKLGVSPAHELKYENFTGFVGSSRVAKYSMSENDANGNSIGYTVETNNSNAIIDYSRADNGILAGLTVTVDVTGTTTVYKQGNGQTDSIYYSTTPGTAAFGTILGSAFQDTFVFTSVWQNNLYVDGTAGSGQPDDILDLTAINQALSYKIDLSAPEDQATINGFTAKFKDFQQVLANNSVANTFTLALAGATRNYSANLDGGGYAGSKFELTGALTGASMASVNITSTSTSVLTLTSNGTSYNANVMTSGFDTYDFTGAGMDLGLSFSDDYTLSTIKTISANSARNNAVSLSAVSSNVNISGSTGAIIFELLNGSNATVVTLNGFNSLELGGLQDFINFKSFISGLSINSGGADASTPDTLTVDFNSTIVLTSSAANGLFSIDVYNTGMTSLTDAHSSFISFQSLAAAANANILILDNAVLVGLQAINVNGNGGTISLRSSDNSTVGITGVALNLTANTSATTVLGSMQIGTSNFQVNGVETFNFGNGNNQVTVNNNASGYTLNGGTGVNTANFTGSNTYAITVDGNQAVSNSNTFTNFYNLTGDGSATVNINMNTVGTGVKYNFTDIDSITFGSNLQGINFITMDNFNVNMTNSMIGNSASIAAVYHNSIALDMSAATINYNMSLSILNLVAASVIAPNVTAGSGGITYLDLSGIMTGGNISNSYNFSMVNDTTNGVGI
ncbi:MAG: hypothetical protein LBQ34_06975, partial [Alphaproteobacteria bacterium]|nr:hypothetical protein [Alphaproteobacteria bacterium]